MTDINSMVERHILEHQSRLNHIDELLRHAQEAETKESDEGQYSAELTALKRERDELSDKIQKLKQNPAEYWQKKAFDNAGPMGIWDAVAQQLEELLERIQGRTRKE